ncbi:hypothetical protein [Legionella worsleiensis]|uniref:Uncharacterized protein n=1 Tax=Legionella worsleiensis TaxID=45076 RepID=A0A0W1AKW6_9GAMM|nr:hypothetical protein [Legionella worsleiensis]KTD81938.1 hypothetical protein Lwor_0241 [Legionella worsleiensis]STY31290.1 Uncharacterised protein [Legionella worsleiensis]
MKSTTENWEQSEESKTMLDEIYESPNKSEHLDIPSSDEPDAPPESPRALEDVEYFDDKKQNTMLVTSAFARNTPHDEYNECSTWVQEVYSEQDDASEEIDDMANLRMSLGELKKQQKQVQDEINSYIVQKNKLAKAQKNYNKLEEEWNKTWIITKIFYWVFSWLFEYPLEKNKQIAKDTLTKEEEVLKNAIPSKYTAESYLPALSLELQQLHSAYNSIKEKIDGLLKIEQLRQEALKLEALKQEQLKQEELSRQKAEKHRILLEELLKTAPSIPSLFDTINTQSPKLGLQESVFESETESEAELESESESDELTSEQTAVPQALAEPETQTANISANHGFFKRYMPSKKTLEAIAVAGVAIAIQHALYG